MGDSKLHTQSQAASNKRCPYCHDAVIREELFCACKSCLAVAHDECWERHGGCPSCHSKEKLSLTNTALQQTDPSQSGGQSTSSTDSMREAFEYYAAQPSVQRLLEPEQLSLHIKKLAQQDLSSNMFSYFGLFDLFLGLGIFLTCMFILLALDVVPKPAVPIICGLIMGAFTSLRMRSKILKFESELKAGQWKLVPAQIEVAPQSSAKLPMLVVRVEKGRLKDSVAYPVIKSLDDTYELRAVPELNLPTNAYNPAEFVALYLCDEKITGIEWVN